MFAFYRLFAVGTIVDEIIIISISSENGEVRSWRVVGRCSDCDTTMDARDFPTQMCRQTHCGREAFVRI
jgi:hypothetical protein